MRAALRGLDARNAERVAQHLVVAGTLVDEDPEQALAHARAARDRASRVAAVREAVGVAAYHAGDYAEAARELRAYRRMSGNEGYRAVLADCERALGRPEIALRLVAEALAGTPEPEEAAELRLVEAGARRDLGEPAAARLVLEAALGGRPRPADLQDADAPRIRLATAYADLLEAEGSAALAREWRDAITAADPETAAGALDVEFSEEYADDDVAAFPAEEDSLDPGPEDGGQRPDGAPTGPRNHTAEDSPEAVDGTGPTEHDSADGTDFAAEVEAEVAELLGELDVDEQQSGDDQETGDGGRQQDPGH